MKRENHRLHVLVQDQIIGEPIPGAEVTVEVPEEDVEVSTSTSAGDDGPAGIATFEFAPRVNTAVVTVEHEQYETQSWDEYINAGGLERTYDLSPRRGTVDIIIGDGETGPSGTVWIRPRNEFVQKMYAHQVEADIPKGGAAEFTMFEGGYDIELGDELSEQATPESQSVVVWENEETTAEFDVVVDVSLTESAQDRLDTLHSTVAESFEGESEAAVASYFGSVFSETLGGIERVAKSGPFKADPDHPVEDVVDGALSAADSCLVNFVEWTKSDPAKELFEASDSSEHFSSEWSDRADFEGFIASDEPLPIRRNQFNEKCDSVSEVLEEAQADGASVAPLEDLLRCVDEFSVDGDDAAIPPAEELGRYYVGMQFLRAIEAAVEDPEKREYFEQIEIDSPTAARSSRLSKLLPFS